MKVREVIRLVEQDGWFQVRQRSHRQFHHATKPGTVTIAGQNSAEMAHGTVKSILRQAGLDDERVRRGI